MITSASGNAGILYVGCLDSPNVRTYDSSVGAVINGNFITSSAPSGALYGSVAHGLLLSGNTLYVADAGNGTVGTFNANTGAVINASFITGMSGSWGMALSGNNLYVAASTAQKIGKYDATSGAVINADFITGLSGHPSNLLVSGNHLFVANSYDGHTVGEYDAITGAAINPNFISLDTQWTPYGMALSGGNLFVSASFTSGSQQGYVAKYDAITGAEINGSFITGLPAYPVDLLVADNSLFVASVNIGVGKYDVATGIEIDAGFITESGGALSLAFDPTPVPEPASGGVLFAFGIGMLSLLSRAPRRTMRNE